jgi:hypothetical protein
MPEISVDIDIYCACGTHLCHLTTAGSKHGRPCFTIKPCPECMEAEKDKGDTEGYERGLADGKTEVEGA